MDTVVVKNLKKTFPGVTAVNNISFSVKKGEIFGLLGVNGAGKSTTINILTGLLRPDSGKITIFGKDFFKNEEEIKNRFNVATAYYSLSTNLTVRQNLEVYARIYNIKNRKKKIEELSERFMISHRFKTKVHSLSSGERTRVVLVKALLNDPELLFLDECTVGLDPDVAEIVRDYLRRYNKETGCTIIFTSHYMQEVEEMCDRIAFMYDGKISNPGKAEELLKELETQTVRLHFSRQINKAQQILRENNISFEKKKNILEFTIQNREKIIYPLLEQFVKKGVAFDDMHLSKPTLEDYFIQRSKKDQNLNSTKETGIEKR
ncbi:ABC transporter ATP-binding protein [Candidatus Woesearchaeota archaeon CG10_big_fil_rev_8_21_14_0_10_45_16]|nr:MAG: ABC transporter ATP-binding protein [Candidatus Woesearchaeota archaeon CG10_big_fil_rev_8_21_14_0_10_45_16]